jgi:hypothetical protein
MSAFVNQLRARGEPLRMAEAGAAAITVRVQMAEVWDTVKVIVSPTEPVLGLKVRALEVLFPSGDFHEDFVLKLKGWEVLDENATLAAAGAVDGSTFLLQHRDRRAVR